MPTRVMTDIQAVAALGNYDAQPAAGYEWEVTNLGSSNWVGVAPAAVPEMNVGVYNGAIGPAWLMQSTDTRGWSRKQRIYINHTMYLRLNNPNAGLARNLSFSAKVARIFGAGTGRVVTTLQTVGAGANMDIQPPAGHEYEITDVGSSLWVGGAPANLPDVSVGIYDGVQVANFMLGANARGWDRALSLHFDNTNYLRLNNTNIAQAVIACVGRETRVYGAGTTANRSDVQTIGAGANWDVQPAGAEEWKVTDFGSGTWVGVAPAALPQITVSLYDGANASVLLQSTDVKDWNHEMEIQIDNTNYLRINDASGAGQAIGFSAILDRIWTS